MDEQAATKWLLYEPVKTTITRISPELAVEIGLNESIVLLQISFWISISNNVRDGKYWTYQTLTEMKMKAFPYWSVDTIRRITHKLRDSGYIIIENHNKRKGDNTQWFALEPEKLSTLKSILCLPSDDTPVSKRETLSQFKSPPLQVASTPLQVASTPLQDRTTLPEITTENTHIKNNTSAPAGAGGGFDDSSTSEVAPSKESGDPAQPAAVEEGKTPPIPPPLPRPRNLIFDAVAEHIFEVSADEVQEDGGRIACISAWLEGKSDRVAYKNRKPVIKGFISAPAEVKHIERFAKDWKFRSPDVNLPMDFSKFVDAWRKWANQKRREQHDPGAQSVLRHLTVLNMPREDKS